MQLTSLLCKWGNWNESQFNAKFRQEIERRILNIHSGHPEGLTDEELGDILNRELGKQLDTDVYRPRRSDLSKDKLNSKKETVRPSFLYDSGETRKNKWGRNCIVWKLNMNNLNSYMGE
jgi:hypothetical protein